jgi:formylglycine-generating enzyme required for sulfatase activity
MSKAFKPHHKRLGIPPEEHPADHHHPLGNDPLHLQSEDPKCPSRQIWILTETGAAAGLLVLVVAAAAIFSGCSQDPPQSAKAPQPIDQSPPKPSSRPPQAASGPKSTSRVASPPGQIPAVVVPQEDGPDENVVNDKPAKGGNPAAEVAQGPKEPAPAAPKPEPPEASALAENPHPNEQPVTAQKLAPPSAEEQKRLLAEIDEVYKQGGTKVALARKLLEDGRQNESNRAEQFVLLRRAGEVARDAGEADLMLEAVDAIVAAGFDIRPFQVKARLLKQLVAQSISGDDFQLLTASASCVKFAEAAAAGGAFDEAAEVLDAAKRSLAKPIGQAQTALRAAKTALTRARTSAEKAEREKSAEDAQAALDGVKSAQSALVECAKGIQQARHDHEALQAAREQLKTAPDDPAANLVLGRWHCFQQGDWDEGLKFLAKGSDSGLKSLAAQELASSPSTFEERVARGDAWWDLAEKADGKTKAGMRQRAGRWYQEALPELPAGLAKAKVEKRLGQLPEQVAAKGGETPARTPPTPARTPPPPAVAPFDEKTAKQHQARWGKFLGVPVVQTNSIGMKLVLIPPGEFLMGSPKELIDEELKADRGDSWNLSLLPGEGPQHRVRITRPYWLGATAVTQEEYERVMGVNPSFFRGDPKRPVEQVTWENVAEFCRRLSELPEEKAAQRSYEPPTEAQWEHACRAGTTTRWFSGDDEAGLDEVAWFSKNAARQTHPVGGKKPNAWGLYDMHGNVWQRCRDWYDGDYYANAPADDPAGPPVGTQRVSRGGGLNCVARHCRSACRSHCLLEFRDANLGFRVSLVPADK